MTNKNVIKEIKKNSYEQKCKIDKTILSIGIAASLLTLGVVLYSSHIDSAEAAVGGVMGPHPTPDVKEFRQIDKDDDSTVKEDRWARNDATVVAKVTGIITDAGKNMIKVTSTGKDSAGLGMTSGTWVELIDDRRELWGLPGTMVKLVNEGDN